MTGTGPMPPLTPSRAALADTTLLRCLGALLIVNSHLEAFYPRSWLAGDGLIGNTLFFSVSGFSLAIAHARRPRPLGPWLVRRLQRVYPPLWIILIIGFLGLNGAWRTLGPAGYAKMFFWPTPYNFVSAIIPSYLLFFPLLRINRARPYLSAAAVLVVPYAIVYALGLPSGLNVYWGSMHVRGLLEMIDCLAAMYLGGWFACRLGSAAERRWTPGRDVALLLTCATIYLTVKYNVNVQHRWAALYGLQHLSAIGLLLALYRLASLPAVTQRLGGAGGRMLRRMSDASLEIYLAHVLFLTPAVAWLRFPLNVITIFAGAIAAGLLLAAAARMVIGRSVAPRA